MLVDTHKHLTAIAVLTVRVKTSQYTLSNDLCKPLEIYVYARKKHPSSGYPTAKHPKHRKLAITDIREKPVNFFLLFNTGVNVGLRNNSANSGFFAKVSVPVHIYNSLDRSN